MHPLPWIRSAGSSWLGRGWRGSRQLVADRRGVRRHGAGSARPCRRPRLVGRAGQRRDRGDGGRVDHARSDRAPGVGEAVRPSAGRGRGRLLRRREARGPGASSLDEQDIFLGVADDALSTIPPDEAAGLRPRNHCLDALDTTVPDGTRCRCACKERTRPTWDRSLRTVGGRGAFAAPSARYRRMGPGNQALANVIAASLPDVRLAVAPVRIVAQDVAGVAMEIEGEVEVGQPGSSPCRCGSPHICGSIRSCRTIWRSRSASCSGHHVRVRGPGGRGAAAAGRSERRAPLLVSGCVR